MRQYLTAAAIAAVAIAHPRPGAAQDPAFETPGVRQYVSEVLSLNAAISARRSSLGAAVERIQPAGALPDPSVTAGIVSVPVPSFDFDAEAMTQIHLGLQQTFPFPGKRDASTALARADSAIFSADLDRVQVDFAAAAARAFFDLAYARTTDAIWRDRLQVAQVAVSVAESRYRAGDVPQTDVLRARLDRSRVEERLDGVVALVTAASARANALRGGVGNDLSPGLLVDDEGAPPFTPRAAAVPDLDEAIARLPRTNPTMRLLRRRAERAERAVRVFQIAGRPDVSASVGTGIRVGGREPFLTAVVGIPVPLWSGRKQDPATRASALESEAARRELADLQAVTEAQVRAAHAELASATVRIDRTVSEILPLAEAASVSALSRYRVGDADFTTVLETQDDLYGARLSLARLIAGYGARRAELAALIGEEWYR